MKEKTREQRRLHFTGRVQGVGFRYSVQRIAADFDVEGFVQNLPDGRVLLVVEGKSDQISCFVDEVGRRMADFIVDVSVETNSPSGQFSGMRIRH